MVNVSGSSRFSFYAENPSCPKCPNEVICDLTTIVALPNYWGYRNKTGHIQMLRCPDQYCCERGQDCNSIDTCNTGRTGILCGQCTDNTTESLFSANCYPMEQCYTLLFAVMYAVCVIVYSVFLAAFRDVKKELLQKVSIAFKRVKVKLKSGKKPKTPNGIEVAKKLDAVDKSDCEQKNSKLIDALLLDNYSRDKNSFQSIWKVSKSQTAVGEEISKSGIIPNSFKLKCQEPDTNIDVKETDELKKDSDSGMKYIQIMLYYVQDATLFKIYLPDAKQQNENILVKLLQFSPEILTVYYQMSDLCFTRNTSAVFKVLLNTIFGPCILLFLCVAYISQQIFSTFLMKGSEGWETFKAKLTQAFLLTVLFSYQKIIKGAFSLIECVDIDHSKVLYIQGDIQCYNWWQRAIEGYLYSSVVPVFITLGICPFFLRKKHMSVAMLLSAMFIASPNFTLHDYFVHNQRKKKGLQVWNQTTTRKHQHSPELCARGSLAYSSALCG